MFRKYKEKIRKLENELDELTLKIHSPNITDLVDRIYGAERSGILLLTLKPDEALLKVLKDLVKSSPDMRVTLKLLNGETLIIDNKEKIESIYKDPFGA